MDAHPIIPIRPADSTAGRHRHGDSSPPAKGAEWGNLLTPDVLGLLITSRCNIACRHCCNESHPANDETQVYAELVRIIDMARKVSTIREIGISGGEPFTFPELLNDIVRYASGLGYSTSVTTNGFWGRSEAVAERLLEALQLSGLCSLIISTSRFHQEFVSFETVVRAAEMALRKGFKLTLNVVTEALTTAADFQSRLVAVGLQVDVVAMPCLPAGRGAKEVQAEEFGTDAATELAPFGNCHTHFRKLAIDRSGNAYPCCSPGGFTAPLALGNVHQASLQDLLAMASRRRLLQILDAVGPAFFLPFLRAAHPDKDIPKKFSDQCHLCHFMLSSPEFVETVEMACDQLAAEAQLATLDG